MHVEQELWTVMESLVVTSGILGICIRKQLQSTVNLRQEALETPGSKLEYAGTTSLEHPQALRKCGPTGFYCTDLV